MMALTLVPAEQVALQEATGCYYGPDQVTPDKMRTVLWFLLRFACDAMVRQADQWDRTAGGVSGVPPVLEFRDPTPAELEIIQLQEHCVAESTDKGGAQ